MQNYEIKLHDIKPLVAIEDYSLYYFLAILAIVIILSATLIYLAIKWYKNRNTFSIREEHFYILKNIDMNDAKLAAYKITESAAIFKDDSEQHSQEYEMLIKKLQEYKYKKYVSDFDEEIKSQIDKYLEIIDV